MVDEVVVRTPAASGAMRRVSWGAIIAGVIVTLIVQVMLGLLGLGVGLATVDPARNDNPTLAAFSSGSGIWTVATVLIATLVGGYVAARLAGIPSRRDGALHGIVTWATSTLIAVYLLTSGVSAVLNGAYGALGGTIQSIGQAAKTVVPNSLSSLPAGLQDQARSLLQRGQAQADQTATDVQNTAQDAANTARQTTGEQDLSNAIPQVLAGLGDNATPEQRNAAVDVIASTANIPRPEAEQRLTQFKQGYDKAMAEAKQAAGRAAATVSATAFVAFAALLLGMIVGAIGGLIGKPARAVGYYRD